MSTTRMVSSRSSAGIWRAAKEVAAAVELAGGSAVVEEDAGEGLNHFHLGNSTRRLLLPMVRHPGAVVTVHDAVPRNAWVRRLLASGQAKILDRLHVVTHSHHAADLLRAAGWQGEATVVPSLLPVSPVDAEAARAWRASWRSDEYELTLVSAGELRSSKGVVEIVNAAASHPTVQVVLLGRLADASLTPILEGAPVNVVHCEAPSDESFSSAIAASDGLLSVRRHSVGETSGPVVQAHRLLRPVAGFALGTLPETCGPGDVLLPGTATVSDLITECVATGLRPLKPNSPQIPDPLAVGQQLISLYRRIGW